MPGTPTLLATIAGLPHLARGPSPVLNRLRSCYRNGRLFGDRFASAAHLFETHVIERHHSRKEREIGAIAAEKLTEAVRLAWTLLRDSLDVPAWTSLHGELAELNHFGGAIPSVGKLPGDEWGRTGAEADDNQR